MQYKLNYYSQSKQRTYSTVGTVGSYLFNDSKIRNKTVGKDEMIG